MMLEKNCIGGQRKMVEEQSPEDGICKKNDNGKTASDKQWLEDVDTNSLGRGAQLVRRHQQRKASWDLKDNSVLIRVKRHWQGTMEYFKNQNILLGFNR